MCTALTFKTNDLYFGRTLDLDFSYGEEIIVTPRNYPFRFSDKGVISTHYAFIGTALEAEGYPLYYDAVNEKGLCAAGLNFSDEAHYNEPVTNKDNVAAFEFIPWILCNCADLKEARAFIEKMNFTNTAFSEKLPPALLHWIISDKSGSITVESVKDELKVYDNPVGVLTNSPDFEKQMHNLSNYMSLSAQPPQNTFSKAIELKAYSRGMGAIGLPGDLSSQSRFVRAAFVKLNSVCEAGEEQSVSQFFHILGSVDNQRGCCRLDNDKYEITVYSCCFNADRGIYYYHTYDNHRICAVDMREENIDSYELIRYPMINHEQIYYQNKEITR